jgi:hypothetical protein
VRREKQSPPREYVAVVSRPLSLSVLAKQLELYELMGAPFQGDRPSKLSFREAEEGQGGGTHTSYMLQDGGTHAIYVARAGLHSIVSQWKGEQLGKERKDQGAELEKETAAIHLSHCSLLTETGKAPLYLFAPGQLRFPILVSLLPTHCLSHLTQM